jgi:hypothetical protein
MRKAKRKSIFDAESEAKKRSEKATFIKKKSKENHLKISAIIKI